MPAPFHILDPTADRLAAWLAERGAAAFRAGQVRKWLYERRAGGFEEMSDLPKHLREELSRDFRIFTGRIAARQQADDGTEKLLIEWPDGHRIECVLLRQGPLRRTICISTQVGCAMGCVFCASGLEGVARNLTAGEIIEQLLLVQRLLADDERLSHIVVMGMGEPLANLDNLLPALSQATAADGLGISPRRITISTVGLPKAICLLAEEGHPYHLAVSLHAPDDELRNKLVPVNANIGIAAILEAADDYFATTGRRLTFEYVLLGELNDHPDHARQLGKLLARREALLNVIPYNPVAGLPYLTPTPSALREFVGILERAGIRIKVRQRKGDQIDAACGQLRRRAPESR